MGLPYAGVMDRVVFLSAALTALDLADQPEVAAAWGEESSCAGMSVGGLTHHLLKQITNTQRVLEVPLREAELVDVHEHYARAEWVGAALDAPANVGVRERSDLEASAGPEAVVLEARQSYAEVIDLLARRRVPDVVAPSWLTWSMTTDDYLTTRLVELTVHSDDLAASVGLATPRFPDSAMKAVLDVLTTVAARRHGQAALLRALSRPQRAPKTISAF